MPIIDPYQVAADAIKAILDAEFTTEGFKAVHDDLHESLGQRRVAVGISPLRSLPLPNNALVSQHFIKVQFYDLWEKKVDPTLAVNPMRITGFARRAAHALETAQVTGPTEDDANAVWYFTVTGIEYPRDPTANKTRFEMTVRALGDAPGVRETA